MPNCSSGKNDDAVERVKDQLARQVENGPGVQSNAEDGFDLALDDSDGRYRNTIVGLMTIGIQWVDGVGGQMERMFDCAAIGVTRVIICSEDDGDFQGLDHLGFGPKNHTVIPRAAADGERRYESDVGDIGRGEHRRKFP